MVPPGAVATSGGAWSGDAGLDAGLNAVKRGLSLFFWDWATLTVGAGTSVVAAAAFALSREWSTAYGFALAAMYATLVFLEERRAARWRAVAISNFDAFWQLVDTAHLVAADGSRTPLRQALGDSAVVTRAPDVSDEVPGTNP